MYTSRGATSLGHSKSMFFHGWCHGLYNPQEEIKDVSQAGQSTSVWTFGLVPSRVNWQFSPLNITVSPHSSPPESHICLSCSDLHISAEAGTTVQADNGIWVRSIGHFKQKNRIRNTPWWHHEQQSCEEETCSRDKQPLWSEAILGFEEVWK